EAGRLEFFLHGRRLEGRFALGRMKGKGRGKENWLLVKMKDEFARAQGAEGAAAKRRPGPVRELGRSRGNDPGPHRRLRLSAKPQAATRSVHLGPYPRPRYSCPTGNTIASSMLTCAGNPAISTTASTSSSTAIIGSSSSFFTVPCRRSTRTFPGCKQPQEMPNSRPSRAVTWVSPHSPNLLAL